ncbi:glycosyltransferase family 4 protein [Nitrospira moscoviensis]|uniref:Putative Glycosyl transferase, group 1 n=1 Tax=Nitrospira moscoviensis TaxID=42253 RepID=A0A0K2GDW9_NITMO|nr:glycosyltransferase family 4 protein [Nitrospira moscoviensis]ALA59049.1 putative Glycosyl transferase, group 1 [Nitrospira moscoviensis]
MTGQGRPTIAMVAPTLGILGGQAVQAQVLADHLRGEGYDVRFVPIDPPLPEAVRWLKRFRFVRTLANECLYVPSLARLRHADIVHVYSASYWSFLLAPLPALLMARRFGKPVLLNYHSGEAADHLARWGSLVHPWLRMADRIVVPSKYLQDVFARYGYRTEVIPNMVDTSRFRYRPRTPLRPHCLSTRNLEPHYGVEQALIAYALLKTAFPDAVLTVAGGGSQEGELRQLARALDLTGVRFLGRVEPEGMPALYDSADIFLNASYVDNQPLSLLEAMASGLPIVTTGVGDIPHMMGDGAYGALVPAGDPAAMAKAATALLEQPERALLMAQRAHQALDRYDWSSVRAEWARAYEELQRKPGMRRAA